MKQSKTQKATVVLNGLRPIMFDRYPGDNQTKLPVERKMYFGPDGKTLVLPAMNVMSFFSAINTTSAPKRVFTGKEYKRVAEGMLSFSVIDPFESPFLRNGKPIVFNGFGTDDYDAKAKVRVVRSVARVKAGVPNPKIRPLLELPWSLGFSLTLLPNDDVNMEIAEKVLRIGGLALGFGTFRGVFGKFEVETFDVKDVK